MVVHRKYLIAILFSEILFSRAKEDAPNSTNRELSVMVK